MNKRILTLFGAMSVVAALLGGSLDGLSRAIVYLEIQRSVWEQVGTNQMEVWYHMPQATNALRKVTGMSGTGFFVIHNRRSYIVTAAHVVGDRSIPDSFSDSGIACLIDTNGIRQPLQLESIRARLPGARWFLHPKADVAVHPYWRPDGMTIANSDLAEHMISTNQFDLLSPVCALGFPVNLGTTDHKISPIATECKISSWVTTVPNIPGLNFIVLDKALAQGYSGAPIFTFEPLGQNGSPVIGSVIGIYVAQTGDVLGGKHSIIVPSSYLLEIFQQPDFLAYEEKSGLISK
jgi:hypothetical protein